MPEENSEKKVEPRLPLDQQVETSAMKGLTEFIAANPEVRTAVLLVDYSPQYSGAKLPSAFIKAQTPSIDPIQALVLNKICMEVGAQVVTSQIQQLTRAVVEARKGQTEKKG